MATEPLEYKITFDTSEVMQKLQEVKNQMDLAFGAQAFNSSGMDPYPFQNAFSGSLAPPPTMSPPNGNGFLSTVSDAFNYGKEFGENTLTSVSDMLNKASEAGRLGYSKFRENMEMGGLISGWSRNAAKFSNLSYEEAKAEAASGGAVSAWFRKNYSYGYNEHMPMTRKEYKDIAAEDLKEEIMDPSLLNLGIGMAEMSSGNPIIMMQGIYDTGTEAAKFALRPFTESLRHQRKTAKYLKSISWRTLANDINDENSMDIADYIRRVPDGVGKDYNIGEVDTVLNDFTEAGGFDLKRSAKEYEDTVKRLFEDHRTVMQMFHTTSREAAQLMGNLSKELGIKDFAGYASNVSVMSKLSGLTTGESQNLIMQGAEMARGSGNNMAISGMGTLSLLQDVRDLARRGIYTDEMVRQGGGLENIALQAARSGMNYGSTPTSMITNGAIMAAAFGNNPISYGEASTLSLQERLQMTAGLGSSTAGIYQMLYGNRKLNEVVSPELKALAEVSGFVKEFQAVNQKTKFSDTDFGGFLTAKGISPTEVDRLVAMRHMNPEDIDKRITQLTDNALNLLNPDKGSKFEQFVDRYSTGLDRGINKLYRAAEVPYKAIEKSEMWVSDALHTATKWVTGGIFEDNPESGRDITFLTGSDKYKKEVAKIISTEKKGPLFDIKKAEDAEYLENEYTDDILASSSTKLMISSIAGGPGGLAAAGVDLLMDKYKSDKKWGVEGEYGENFKKYVPYMSSKERAIFKTDEAKEFFESVSKGVGSEFLSKNNLVSGKAYLSATEKSLDFSNNEKAKTEYYKFLGRMEKDLGEDATVEDQIAWVKENINKKTMDSFIKDSKNMSINEEISTVASVMYSSLYKDNKDYISKLNENIGLTSGDINTFSDYSMFKNRAYEYLEKKVGNIKNIDKLIGKGDKFLGGTKGEVIINMSERMAELKDEGYNKEEITNILTGEIKNKSGLDADEAREFAENAYSNKVEYQKFRSANQYIDAKFLRSIDNTKINDILSSKLSQEAKLKQIEGLYGGVLPENIRNQIMSSEDSKKILSNINNSIADRKESVNYMEMARGQAMSDGQYGGSGEELVVLMAQLLPKMDRLITVTENKWL